MPYIIIYKFEQSEAKPHPVEKDGRFSCEFCIYKPKSFPSEKSREQHYKYFHRFE